MRNTARQAAALIVLFAIGGMAVAGPSGLLAWGQNTRALETRRTELAQLTRERDALRNRVDLLDPRHVDPDLASELVRSGLGVAHRDEKIILLH